MPKKNIPSHKWIRIFSLLIITFAILSGKIDALNPKPKNIPPLIEETKLQKAYGYDTALNKFSDDGIASTSSSPSSSSPVQIKEIGIGQQQYNSSESESTQDLSVSWGVAKQLDEHTWTIKVGLDKDMATPKQILDALNTYRRSKNRGELSWDDKLAAFADSRAQYFDQIGKLDGHAGFMDFVNNQDGFHKLGFAGLGENSSYGYKLQAVHLIEWIYAGDKPHDDNQLDPKWQYVGIGVYNTSTNLIFASDKL